MAIDFKLSDIGIGAGPPAAPAPAPAPAPQTHEAGGGPRLTPAQAVYRDEVIFCGECAHFQEPNACDLVQGGISVDGTCSFAEYGERGDDEGMESPAEELAESGTSGVEEPGSRSEGAEVS